MSSRITQLDFQPLDIPLVEPFTIATGRLDHARNVLVRLTLDNGVVGYGEAAPFEPISGENQVTVLAALDAMRPLVIGREAAWRAIARDLESSFHAQASARTAVEMALLDAVTRTWGVPLYRFLGGASDRVETDLTVPIVPPERAQELARAIAARGIQVVKTKVGQDVKTDLARVLAIRQGYPDCELILDANGGLTPTEALRLLDELGRAGIRPLLLEQPVPREDWAGMIYVTARSPVPIAADETVFTPADALRVAESRAAHVINVKLMKSGLMAALDIVAIARAAHLGLMIGGMIESRLAISCSAHVAAGLGDFRHVDLDTPMLLATDPFEGGYRQEKAVYHLESIKQGIGVRPKKERG